MERKGRGGEGRGGGGEGRGRGRGNEEGFCLCASRLTSSIYRK